MPLFWVKHDKRSEEKITELSSAHKLTDEGKYLIIDVLRGVPLELRYIAENSGLSLNDKQRIERFSQTMIKLSLYVSSSCVQFLRNSIKAVTQ